MSKPKRIIDEALVDKLIKLPDLFFEEDMELHSKPKLVFLMQSLDEASDFINDYLTQENYSVVHSYPDISNTEQ